MANSVFSSLDSYFNNNYVRADVSRSVFDLSHIVSFDTDFGVLLPFYLEDCLPNDDFKISNIIKLKAIPFACPVFTNFKIRTYYYYVPYYLLWHNFDRFISGGRNGSYVAELPYITDSDDKDKFTVLPNSIADYLGFPVGTYSGLTDHPERRISAFPFAAYQRIYRDYFLNQDMQLPFVDGSPTNSNTWLPDDDLNFVLQDGANRGIFSDDDYSSTRSHLDPLLGYLRFQNWKKDYFTSGMYSPQRGPAPAMPVTGTINVDGNSAVSSVVAGNTYPLNLYVPGSNPEKGYFMLNYADRDKSSNLKDAFSHLKVNLDNSVGFTIDDLRLAVQISEWLERNMRTKAQYNDFLRIHFDDAPLDERLTKPYFIGGSSQNLQVTEILSTSETTTSVQGTATGHADSFDSQEIGRFHSHEFGLIMGLMSIMPDTMYTQGVDRHWSKLSKFDFYFPEFAQLSPQPVLNKELFYDFADSTDNDKVFCYQGRFDEYRHHRNVTVGSLRNPNTIDFYSWTASREFGATPSLNSNNFLSTDEKLGVLTIPSATSTVRHDFIPTKNTVNPFIVQVGVSVRAVRPLPYVNQPQGLL